MKRIFILVLIVLLLAGCSQPASQDSEGIQINEPWVRPAASGGNTAVYFTIDNSGGGADQLMSASSDAAKMVEVHMTITDADGNSKMMHQEAVDVPAGETVTFEPGGLHVMLMNLNEDLQPGAVLPVTLAFAEAGEVVVEAVVREP